MCKAFEIEDFENVEGLSQEKLIKLWHRSGQYHDQLTAELDELNRRIRRIYQLIEEKNNL